MASAWAAWDMPEGGSGVRWMTLHWPLQNSVGKGWAQMWVSAPHDSALTIPSYAPGCSAAGKDQAALQGSCCARAMTLITQHQSTLAASCCCWLE